MLTKTVSIEQTKKKDSIVKIVIRYTIAGITIFKKQVEINELGVSFGIRDFL